MFGESKNVIPLGKGLELRVEKKQQNIEMVQSGIANLQSGKEQFEEWQRIALEQGDEQSALLYEIKALENEMIIIEGEMLCNDMEQAENERWHRHFDHAMEIDNERAREDRLSYIDSELELVSDYLAFLLESEEVDKEKIEELQKRKDGLEDERIKLNN